MRTKEEALEMAEFAHAHADKLINSVQYINDTLATAPVDLAMQKALKKVSLMSTQFYADLYNLSAKFHQWVEALEAGDDKQLDIISAAIRREGRRLGKLNDKLQVLWGVVKELDVAARIDYPQGWNNIQGQA